MSETKICKSCNKDKVITDFYFRKETNTYKSQCKRCIIDGVKIEKSTTHKVCKHCGEEKPFSEYQKAGGGKWLQPYCKPCDSIRKNKHKEANIVHVKQKAHQNYISKRVLVPNHIKEQNMKLVTQNLKEAAKKYRDSLILLSIEEKKQRKSESDRKYRENNKEKVQAMKRKYYDLKGNDMAKAWQKKQKGDIVFVTKKRLRGRVYMALKRGIKSESTMKLLGCSIDFFKEYFESKFTEGMNWDVYMQGGIHIDHIRACKHYDLTNPEEQKKCFHYSNLQPLWAIDNLIKGTKDISICQIQ